jgi:hypothetical protein
MTQKETPVQLPPDSYGLATPRMQRLIDRAMGIRWFQGEVQRDVAFAAWERHLAGLRSVGVVAPAVCVVDWLSGSPRDVVEVDASGDLNRDGRWAGWFRSLEQLASRVDAQFVQQHRRNRIRPPLWAFPGHLNVRTEPLVANAGAATACHRAFPRRSDGAAAWLTVCLAEEILSLALAWECADAASGVETNPLEAVLDVFVSGAIPLGWGVSGRTGLYCPRGKA